MFSLCVWVKTTAIAGFLQSTPDPFLEEAFVRRMRSDAVVLSDTEMSLVADELGK
jgi:hypothetical protein